MLKSEGMGLVVQQDQDRDSFDQAVAPLRQRVLDDMGKVGRETCHRRDLAVAAPIRYGIPVRALLLDHLLYGNTSVWGTRASVALICNSGWYVLRPDQRVSRTG
jgi:hypothetical protein